LAFCGETRGAAAAVAGRRERNERKDEGSQRWGWDEGSCAKWLAGFFRKNSKDLEFLLLHVEINFTSRSYM
jgi:hypothetical protein